VQRLVVSDHDAVTALDGTSPSSMTKMVTDTTRVELHNAIASKLQLEIKPQRLQYS
jgi:hypothetical protein